MGLIEEGKDLALPKWIDAAYLVSSKDVARSRHNATEMLLSLLRVLLGEEEEIMRFSIGYVFSRLVWLHSY